LIKHQKYLIPLFLFFSAISGHPQNMENSLVDSTLINKFKQTKPVSFILKTNLLPIIYSKLPLTSEYRLLGEFSLTSKQSLCVGGSYIGKTILYNIVYPPRSVGQALYVKGYRIQLGYKYYLAQKKFIPSGIYLSPHLSYYTADYSNEPLNNYVDFDKLTNLTINFLFGFQFILKNKVAFDLFSGLGYNKYTYIQYRFINKIKRISYKNPADFGGIINLTPISFIPIGFNFGLAF
jgi:hypothetical protein